MQHHAYKTGPWIGTLSGAAVAGLSAIYVAVLAAGLLSLPTPDSQIADPWFTLMEILILLIAPLMVRLAIAMQAWVPEERRALGSLAVVFFSICAALTMAVHAAVLVNSRHPFFSDPAIARAVISFQWPSVVYAIDIVAWDVAFPTGALVAAIAMQRTVGTNPVRMLLLGSAALAFGGLIGVPLNDMRLRNVGILGYALLFPIAAGTMAALFLKESRPAVAPAQVSE